MNPTGLSTLCQLSFPLLHTELSHHKTHSQRYKTQRSSSVHLLLDFIIVRFQVATGTELRKLKKKSYPLQNQNQKLQAEQKAETLKEETLLLCDPVRMKGSCKEKAMKAYNSNPLPA